MSFYEKRVLHSSNSHLQQHFINHAQTTRGSTTKKHKIRSDCRVESNERRRIGLRVQNV